jgi:putative hemolysin
MELIRKEDLIKAANLEYWGGENTAKIIMSVFKFDQINKIYSTHFQKPIQEFADAILHETGIKYELSGIELQRIPKTGPFIIIANHPLGGLEGMILLHALLSIRPDLKIMGNFLLQKIVPINKYVLPVNPFENHKSAKTSFEGFRGAIEEIERGHPVVIFPAGEVSTFQNGNLEIADKRWDKSILKMLQKLRVTVIPVYFHGSNSVFFHWLGMIHPMLRTAKLPSEILNKRNQLIKVKIGLPIPVIEQDLYPEIHRYGRFLRAKTYSLSSIIDVNDYFKKNEKNFKAKVIIDPVDTKRLMHDLHFLPEKFTLFSLGNFTVYCAPAFYIPNIMLEIARLREITFREIGEGTNLEKDLDEFDIYYHQLFIWDNVKKALVGGYRVGLGKEIIALYGIKGFYTRTLFKMSKKLLPLLNETVELGRSFIVKEYQRKPLSLFLLWKGILYFLLKNETYRYLLGPVSISNQFTKLSKHYIVDFIKRNYFHTGLSEYIKPRKPFTTPSLNTDIQILTEEIHNFEQLDTIIRDIEIYQTRIPVLLKKYLQLGGRIVCFNVDPAFNNSLDGLMILDLADVPKDMIHSLSKETEDDSIFDKKTSQLN